MSQPSGKIENISDTALWVAVRRAEENDRPDALYRDPLALRLAGERGKEIARQMPYGGIMAWVMAMRTVAIDQLVLNAIAGGARTVVNIGAGLDTRPYRMAELPPGLRWIEVDFAPIIDLKNEKLRDEKPRCRLERFAVDFADQASCRALYDRIGAESGPAVVITEGVLPYLTSEQVAALADTLHSVAGFRFWIQDYREGGFVGSVPKSYTRRLKNAPFLFKVANWMEFFGSHGWAERQKIVAFEQGQRLGRPFPIPFPWKYLMWTMPLKKREEFRNASGYVLLERK